MPKIETAGTEIYYEAHGEGPPVMLVTGLGGLAAYWRPQIASFSRRYGLIVHDHRGVGQSERSKIDYSVEQMAGDTLGLMDALGIESAHFVGHSTGGAIGQILALEHPRRLRSLVLSSTWTRADAFFRWSFDVRKEVLLARGLEAYQRSAAVFIYPPQYMHEHAARLQADLAAAATAPVTTVEIAASRIDAILAFDRARRLGEIRVPTLVICAKDDRLTPAYFSQELARAIPGARLALLETGGHACTLTNPEEYDRHVLGFLDDVSRGKP